MTQSENPPLRRLYRARDESIWALIRQRYLSGETQKTLALAYDVPVCTIQKRITREGWSKRAAIGIRPTFGGMAAPRAFEIVPPEARWPDAYEAAPQDSAPPETGGRPFSRIDPPEDFRGGPRPLPGLPHRPTHVWTPPPGYGPMPPHLVPPVQRPPSDDGAAPVTPADVADQAVAAAGRALSEGRYAEAERLGKLAESMRRQAGFGGAGAKAAPLYADDEDDVRDLPLMDRPVTCTPATCYMRRADRELEAKLGEIADQLLFPAREDVLDWADMAQGMGLAPVDEDVRLLVAALRREGPGQHHQMLTEFGFSSARR